jgi:hypothetical protein
MSTLRKHHMSMLCFNFSVFGKTMENIRKHKDIRLVSNVRHLRKLTTQPNFRTFSIYTKHLAAVQMAKKEVVLCKPSYLGMCVLDVSKLLMFQFHYEKMDAMYGTDRLKLLMTDTDSLVYHIQTEDVYADMCAHLDDYDTSGYPPDHPAYDRKNSKVIIINCDEKYTDALSAPKYCIYVLFCV